MFIAVPPSLRETVNVDCIPGCGIVIHVASTSACSVHQTSELSIERELALHERHVGLTEMAI